MWGLLRLIHSIPMWIVMELLSIILILIGWIFQELLKPTIDQLEAIKAVL